MNEELKRMFVSILRIFNNSHNNGLVPLLISESIVEVYGKENALELLKWVQANAEHA